MMFKCESCGHLFEEGEQAVWEERHGLDTPPYEQWDGCPVCKGGYEEVRQCKECDDWYTEVELYEGWCESCLRETINYDTFFEYCEANKDEQYLDTFVMCDLLKCEYVPEVSSYEFHDLMVQVYKDRVEQIKHDKAMFGETCLEIIDACIRFVMDDDGSNGREDYAYWLNGKKEVK